MTENTFVDLQSHFPPSAGPGGEAPPPYSTLPTDASESMISALRSPGAASVVSYGQTSLKLSYMDFIPRLMKKRLIGKNEYETFSALLQRANTWLEEHNDVQLVSCETVTWFGVSQKEIFSDSSAFRKSPMTTFLRGLRFWYLTKVIPSPSRGSQPAQVVQCQTFPARPSETFTMLLTNVNEILSSTSCAGRIISIETVRMQAVDGNVKTEETFWKEDVGDTKQVTFAFRIYTVLCPMQGYESIGYQDFVPSRTNRNKENKGYELYADLMDRATRWIARQQGVRFTNLQTISIKIKKNVSSEERCSFTEHGQRTTNFLNIIRAYFVIQHNAAAAASAPSEDNRLTYRTFSPQQVTYATANTPAKYEEVRALLERINHWLQLTGARLFSIETIPVRLLIDAHQSLGPEATFVSNRESGSAVGKFLFHIRVYLTGDYTEPPNAVSLVLPQLSVAAGY